MFPHASYQERLGVASAPQTDASSSAEPQANPNADDDGAALSVLAACGHYAPQHANYVEEGGAANVTAVIVCQVVCAAVGLNRYLHHRDVL